MNDALSSEEKFTLGSQRPARVSLTFNWIIFPLFILLKNVPTCVMIHSKIRFPSFSKYIYFPFTICFFSFQ